MQLSEASALIRGTRAPSAAAAPLALPGCCRRCSGGCAGWFARLFGRRGGGAGAGGGGDAADAPAASYNALASGRESSEIPIALVEAALHG